MVMADGQKENPCLDQLAMMLEPKQLRELLITH
jgi:hypothetical protein